MRVERNMSDKQKVQGKIQPGHGGCWFCYRDDGDDLTFDTEWDTFVHVSCIQRTLAADPEHPEAECMRYLL